MMTVSSQTLTNLVLIQLCSLCQLTYGRVALVFLLETVNLVVDLVQATYLVERQTNDTTLLSNSLEDALTDPPYGVGDEFKTTCFIKFLCGLDQADVTLINQVSQCQPLVLILLGHGHNETQVGCNQLILCCFAFWSAFTYLLCKLNFLINRDQWCTSNFNKILVKSLT